MPIRPKPGLVAKPALRPGVRCVDRVESGGQMGIGLMDTEGQFETRLLPLGVVADLKISLACLPFSLAPAAQVGKSGS